MDVQIRWLIRRDMSDVVKADWLAYRQPWDAETYLEWLRQRNCIGMVAVKPGYNDEIIYGSMVYELHRRHLHLLRLSVHPAYQRRGVGTALIQRLKDKLSQQRRTSITIAVPDDELAGHLFLRSQGFEATEVIRGTVTDCYLFEYLMPVAEAAGMCH